MDWNLLRLLAPYLTGLLIPLVVGIYAFRHREVNGAIYYSGYVIARTAWNLGLTLELLSPTFEGKVNWVLVEGGSTSIVLILLLGFVLTYTEWKPGKSPLVQVLLALVPAVYFLVVITNSLHGWILQSASLVPGNRFSLLQLKLTPIDWIYLTFALTMVLFLIILLIRKFLHTQPIYRSQAYAIALGLFLDSLGVGLAMGLGERGLIPPFSAVCNLIVSWSLFRYRLFDLRPIARDALFEKLTDMVLVLDARNRIVDINPSALKAFGLLPRDTVGKQAEQVFANWPELVEKLQSPAETNVEVVTRRTHGYSHHDVNSTFFHDRQGNYQGRIMVARDITAYAALQWKQMELNETLDSLNKDLEERVSQRTRELAQAYDTTLEGWAKALELRDKETEGHSRRVIDLTLRLARALDVAEAELDDIHRGALLHDIGKMAIPDDILRKKDRLTREERGIVNEHPTIAYNLLSPIKFLEKALVIPYCHHERWDGKGYPRGLKQDEIPLPARIFSLADVWDALQSDRAYRKPWTRMKAVSYLKEQAGHIFDPRIVQVFVTLVQRGEI